VPIVLKSESLDFLELSGPVKACNGIALPFTGKTSERRMGTFYVIQRVARPPVLLLLFTASLCLALFGLQRVVVVVVVVVVVWGPESGCTAACRLVVSTPCVLNVHTFTASRLHVTTTLEILAAKVGNRWARNFR
jgi:hypothetical protein